MGHDWDGGKMIVAKETHPDLRSKLEARPMVDYLVLLAFRYNPERVKVLRKWPGASWSTTRKVWMIPDTKEAVELLSSWKAPS